MYCTMYYFMLSCVVKTLFLKKEKKNQKRNNKKNSCDKRTTLKMNGLQQNESISRLNETLFLSYQKVPKI